MYMYLRECISSNSDFSLIPLEKTQAISLNLTWTNLLNKSIDINTSEAGDILTEHKTKK